MMSRLTSVVLLSLLVALSLTLAVARRGPSPAPEEVAPLGPPLLDPNEEIAFVCPIHPDYTSPVGGNCPRDGMELVEANPFDVRDYRLEMYTDPAVVQPGEPALVSFAIFHPGTGDRVRELLTVHDRRYHLFVISQDGVHFQHLHPVSEVDGSWSVQLTLPADGYYKLISDFVPNGGSAQLIARPLVTADYSGDLMTREAHFTAIASPERSRQRSDGGLAARVTHDPETFVAGLYGHLRYELSEADSGRPITDLQPYLGSFGHMVIMSEDMVHYVHSHPLDTENSDEETGPMTLMIPMDDAASRAEGGPEVTFEGLMPKAGRYRAWAQFRWGDRVHTLTHDFTVEEEL